MGRNDRTHNRNKYNPKGLSTEGNRVLPNGSIVFNVIRTPKKKKGGK